MKRRLALECIFLFLIFCIPFVHGQEMPSADNINAEQESAGPLDQGSPPDSSVEGDNSQNEAEKKEISEADYIDMDIRTSTLIELASWCRELGLSEGGTREELASRLRSYYEIPPGRPASAGQRIITIESAKTTEYFTLDVVDEEYARLKGDVIVSLKDGNATHRIKAWEILYNRTRNVMTASGKVEYVKEEGDTVETFRGESITVNLDNWSSIFMDGVSERSKAGSTTAYRFAGTVISRNSEEVTVLTGAEITNPTNEEAFWSLHASKLWLLPGNDWAILNAVLKVGNIPLLYLPFFYYPSDEIVFHPVLGFRSREGTFLQTTTYILGRPKTEAITENSITRIFGSASENMDKKREGVFLRSSGEKRTDPNDTRLSLLLDAYVNLGAYLGVELALPRKGMMGEFNLSAGLGFTRDIYFDGYNYTPFLSYYNTGSKLNWGMVFTLAVPFRYRINMTGSFQIKNGAFSWAIPFYSDPYVDRDFMRRSETLDWLAMLREGASADNDTIDDTSLSSYEWRLSGSFTPSVAALSPYLSSFSVSSISSSMLFSYRNTAGYLNRQSPPNPGESFFYPNRLTIYSISASLSGSPYATGRTTGTSQARTTRSEAASGDSLLPDSPLSPWDDEGSGDDSASGQLQTSRQQNTQQDVFSFSPPVLSQRFSLPASGGPRLSFDYRLTPSSASELSFQSSNWTNPDDIKGEVSTILTRIKSDGNLGLSVSHSGGGAYSGSFRLYGTGSWQGLHLNEDADDFATGGVPDDAKIKAARDRTYREIYFTSSWDLSTTLRPFYQSTIWNNTSVQYSLRGLLGKTSVDTTGTDPKWDWLMGKWNKTDIQTHQITASVSANITDYSQSLSVSAVLPPKEPSLSGNATLRAWISETSVRTSIREPWDNELIKFEPVYITEILRFGSWGSFRQYVVIDPDDKGLTTFTSDLSLWGFSASFSMLYSRPWKFNPDYGTSSPDLWTQTDSFNQPFDEKLVPREFTMSYSRTFSTRSFWKNRLTFSMNLNTNLRFNLQQYTSSSLDFSLGFSIGIARFLDLSFSTRSENAVIYRYFQKLPFFDSPPVPLYPGAETNFFKDLINSFRFDSPELRRKSGFKLKSLNVSLTHNLGDWNASLSVNMTPYLPPGSTVYKISNEISFLIQWIPIGEIKTQIDYSKDNLTIK